MITAEEKAWFAIAEARGLGPKTLWSIADYLTREEKTASWLLQHPEAMKVALNGRQVRSAEFDVMISRPSITASLERGRASILHPLHSDFPERVKFLRNRHLLPAILYTWGNTTLLNRTGVAIVGSRHATEQAISLADKLASQLVSKKVNIISGYAKGIDTAAHLAALRGNGTTTMVLSEGINHFHPKRELKSFLTTENSLVISQFEPSARWTAHFAMTRNRLVCALSGAVVVVVSGPERDAEGKMSGTFAAGTTALEMSIPVFAVSPSWFQDVPTGNSQLIRKGCREWNPSDGALPILAALFPKTDLAPKQPSALRKKSKAKQLSLFDETKI